LLTSVLFHKAAYQLQLELRYMQHTDLELVESCRQTDW
jgi:hypothetical protein